MSSPSTVSGWLRPSAGRPSTATIAQPWALTGARAPLASADEVVAVPEFTSGASPAVVSTFMVRSSSRDSRRIGSHGGILSAISSRSTPPPISTV